MSPRFVLAHVRNLDYYSAFMAEVRGGQQFRGWDENRYLLAAHANALRTLIYITILANIDPKKSKKPKPPEMWPLPDKQAKKQDKPGSFASIAKRGLAAAKKRKAAQWQEAQAATK